MLLLKNVQTIAAEVGETVLIDHDSITVVR